ncbi:MAG TPA: glycosyltransferase family 39 protein [Polyangiaceae bacterium]
MTDDVATTDEQTELESVFPDPNDRGRRLGISALAAGLTLASLFGPLSASGIWEPPELKVADLARRIAVNLLGAQALSVPGGVNTVPTAGELGRGELPFTAIAAGLKLFGLSEWAGRLPMALFGLLGVVATVVLLARLVDRVTASFAAIVLATTPLYFLQSRTILGDIVTLSGLAVAVCGLAIAVFDTRPRTFVRVLYFLFGAGGMAAGFGARGVLVGVATPALAIGLAWLLRRGSSALDGLSAVFGALSLALALATLFLGVRALVGAEEHQFIRLLGATVEARRQGTTHDAIVLELGHALFPWSAVVPFALGRMLLPPTSVSGAAFERESHARVVLLSVAIVAFGMYGAVAPRVGVLPFGAVFALAGCVAMLFRDLERGAPGSRTLALGVIALIVLFYTDFQNFPERGLAAFVVDDPKFPDSFKERALHILQAGTAGSAALFALFAFEREERHPAFVGSEYRGYLRVLRTAGDGNVFFVIAALEVALLVLAPLTFLSDRFFHIKAIDTMAVQVRLLAKVGFAVLPVIVVLPLGAMAARDVCRVVLRKLSVTRGAAALLAVAAFGATLSFGYYPLLARQISPKEVFESFQRLSRPGEEFAMIGGGSGGARYYARRDVRTLSTEQEAFSWLTEKEGERRWLVVRATDIGQLNSQFRSRPGTPPHNLPVLDARSSEILLVSNQIRPGEKNENPFAKWILDRRPSPAHRLDVDFNGQLHGIGWEVTTPDGERVSQVRAGKKYLFHFYYEVMRPISGEWQTFIHVDGYQRRYNGDHDTLEGKYPFHLWRTGDFMEDIHPFELEPNFNSGTYTVFFGLFRGDQRLEVKHGGAEDNRVNAGPLEVQ